MREKPVQSELEARDRRPVLRVAEICPKCRAPLVLREEPNGEPRIGCSSCKFDESYDRRAAALMDRILFLQRELTKRDPMAPLWEECP